MGGASPPETAEIPGGNGLIGTNRPELPVDSEAPPRRTRIKPFRIDRTTVTNARFTLFVEDTGYVTDAERLGDSFVFLGLLPATRRDDMAVAAAPWWRVVKGVN